MRTLLLALCLGVAAPALAQTPPPQTVTFEGVGTPMAYLPGAKVPKAARIKKLTLAAGGYLQFRTRGGADYAALVTHLGTTGIVGVGSKGKILQQRFVEVRIRKSPGARFESFNALQAGPRLDNKGTTDTADDETFYDNPSVAFFILRATDDSDYPIGGGTFQILRTEPESYDVTTTSLDFVRISISGDMVYDDLIVSFGH